MAQRALVKFLMISGKMCQNILPGKGMPDLELKVTPMQLLQQAGQKPQVTAANSSNVSFTCFTIP